MIDVAFFDMDHTVLDMDCDVSWKYFLADNGLAPPTDRAEADRFLELYYRGKTPVNEFVKFQLNEFVNRSPEEMRQLAAEHFRARVLKNVFPQAREEISKFNQQGIPTYLLTGTNRIIAEPIAQSLGIGALLATEPEIKDGHFTGKIEGPFLMREGKLKRASDVCISRNIALDRVTFYADSITDVTLLEKVGFPVVVNPKENLRAVAEANQWRVERWQLDKNKSTI